MASLGAVMRIWRERAHAWGRATPGGADVRPPRLVLRFALYTALGLALAAGAILWLFHQNALDRAQREAAARARALAYTTLPDTLVPSDLERPVSPSRRAALDEVVVRRVLVEGAGLLRVNLVSPEGTVTYSSEHSLIGTKAGDADRLAKAMRGAPVFRVTRLGAEGPRTLAAYVPVRLSGGVRPSGVVQVYGDYTPVAREVAAAVKEVAIVLAAVLLALYGALFPVLGRVTRGLAAHARADAERRALVEQNERLRQLDRLKDDFVSTVSHELRTPLTSIRGYLEILREDEVANLTDEQQRFLEVIDRNADRLLQLVGDLLFIAQLRAGKLGLDITDVDLAAVAAESVDAARPLAESQGITLALDASQVSTIAADRARVGQLIDNLVSNALKFTPEAGRVDVTVRAASGRAQIEVSDTGMGIASQEQEKVFERFFRAQNAHVHAVQGSGLGLAIAKAIVEAHQGRIRVESREGEGTTFRVELPLTEAEPRPKPLDQAAA
jgi:signal transduction histidine kinase